jgi:hypothetical protein
MPFAFKRSVIGFDDAFVAFAQTLLQVDYRAADCVRERQFDIILVKIALDDVADLSAL